MKMSDSVTSHNFRAFTELQIENKVCNPPAYAASIAIQWHITTRCDYRCRHCYMDDPSTSRYERDKELQLNDLLSILNNLNEFSLRNRILVHMVISGGDPLLHPAFWDFAEEIRHISPGFALMTNPDHLSHEAIEKLQAVGCCYIQMSLDGRPITHDFMRGSGAFTKLEKASQRLVQHGMKFSLMATLSSQNKSELTDMMEISASLGADCFCFDVVSRLGRANQFISSDLNKDDMRQICNEYLDAKAAMQLRGVATLFAEKIPLFKLARWERGEFWPVQPQNNCFASGCLIGWKCATILVDGTMVACRRLPLPIGNLLKDNLEDLWFQSSVLNEFRTRDSWHGCGTCELFYWCRGCPATAVSLSKEPQERSPLCWCERLERLNKRYSKEIELQTELNPTVDAITYYQKTDLSVSSCLEKTNHSDRERLNWLLRIPPFAQAFLCQPYETCRAAGLDKLSDRDLFNIYAYVVRRIEAGMTAYPSAYDHINNQ